MKPFIFVTILISTFLMSCDPIVTFDKPQPLNIKALESFPSQIQGKYLADSTNVLLTISNNTITKYYEYDIIQHKDSIDKSFQIIGDTLMFSNGKKRKNYSSRRFNHLTRKFFGHAISNFE